MIEAVLALGLVAISHFLRFRTGLNLSDEGFLWNGALRIGQGRIPIRDYKSYDPGRFYWCWAGMKLFGTGLLGLRHSAAVFQALGLWAGLAALGSVTDHVLALCLGGVACVIWMQPRHKLFEHAMALIAVFTMARLIGEPSVSTALFAGMVTGFAGVMGRNHGTYAFVSSFLTLGLLSLMGRVEAPGALLAVWAAGIVIGYAPMWGMFLFVRGMFRRYLNDKVLVFFRRGGIDLALSPPWPWTVKYAGLTPLDRVSRFLTGLHFILLPAFYTVTLGWLVLGGQFADNAVLSASCIVGLCYMHHASSRSDLAHLCQVMQPFLCGVLALFYSTPNPLVFWLAPLGLIAIAILVIRQIDPWMDRLKHPERYTEIEILGDRLMILRGVASLITHIRALTARHLAPGDGLFVAPHLALLYPVLQKQTPVRSDFLLFPETDAVQDELIGDLEKRNINWALTQDVALDRRDDLRFRNTHARVWAYLERNFDRIQTTELNEQWDFWRRKTGENTT